VIKATAKLMGADQQIDSAKFNKIGGSGSVETTLVDGSFIPKSKTKLATDFTATIDPGSGGKEAGGKAAADKKPVDVTFHLEQAVAVTPK
jgi:hypothetical protein